MKNNTHSHEYQITQFIRISLFSGLDQIVDGEVDGVSLKNAKICWMQVLINAKLICWKTNSKDVRLKQIGDNELTATRYIWSKCLRLKQDHLDASYVFTLAETIFKSIATFVWESSRLNKFHAHKGLHASSWCNRWIQKFWNNKEVLISWVVING